MAKIKEPYNIIHKKAWVDRYGHRHLASTYRRKIWRRKKKKEIKNG